MMSKLWTFCPPKKVLGSLMLNIADDLAVGLEIFWGSLCAIGHNCIDDVVKQAEHLIVFFRGGQIDHDLHECHECNHEGNPVFNDEVLHSEKV